MFRANDERSAWWPVAVLLVVAFALRLGWGLTRGDDLSGLPDQIEYVALAESLLAGDGLVFGDPRFADEVRAFRMPGYPLLVAACGANLTAVRVVQAGLDASVVLAAVLLARRLVGGGGLVAGLLVALNPFLIYFTGLLLTETLFTALLAWGAALVAGVWPRRAGWWLGLGLLVAAVYVRPAAVLLPCLVAGASVMLHELHPFRGRFALPVLSVLALTLLALSPWAARNYFVVGSPVLTTTNTGLTLYDGLHPDADGSSDQSHLAHLPQLRRMDEVQRSAYLAAQARRFAEGRPSRALRLAGAKLARTWSPVPLSEAFGSTRNRIVALAYAVPLFGLTLAGLLGVAREREGWRPMLFLLLPAVYLTLGTAITVGSLRYRVPAEPLMAVVAAGGALALTRAFRGVSD